MAMSHSIISQNTPKVIWEKKISELSYSPNYIFNDNGINISPEGKILIHTSYSNKANNGYAYNINAFDQYSVTENLD